MTACNRFKEVRKSQGMTQADFGKALGISRDTVANIEGGRIPLKDIHVLSLCRTFAVSETWLLTGDGEMHSPLSDEQEIAQITAKMFKEDDEDRKQLFRFIASLDVEDLKALKRIWEKGSKYFNKEV